MGINRYCRTYCYYCCLIGAVSGFFLARKYMKDYLEKNPPVNEDMLRSMMMSMGQNHLRRKFAR